VITQIRLPFDGRFTEEQISRANRAVDFFMSAVVGDKSQRLEKIKPVNDGYHFSVIAHATNE